MALFTADLDGDSWRVSAPDGSRVVIDAGWPWRLRLAVPGLLSPLSVWEVIEGAREGLWGLRVVGHSAYGTSHYIVSAGQTTGLPLFEGGLR